METKKEEKKVPKKNYKKPKENLKIEIKEKNNIEKIESGVFHNEHGKLLYKPDDEFEVKEDATKAEIKRAFAKSLKVKKLNKKVLSEFIEIVA